jgi:hypothetical protein
MGEIKPTVQQLWEDVQVKIKAVDASMQALDQARVALHAGLDDLVAEVGSRVASFVAKK